VTWAGSGWRPWRPAHSAAKEVCRCTEDSCESVYVNNTSECLLSGVGQKWFPGRSVFALVRRETSMTGRLVKQATLFCQSSLQLDRSGDAGGHCGPGPAPFLPSGPPIVAGGPLRARPRPTLRSGPEGSQTFPGRSRRSLGKLCARTLHFAALSRPKSPVPEGKRTGGNAPHRKVLLQ
jgi:hypothetical protein